MSIEIEIQRGKKMNKSLLDIATFGYFTAATYASIAYYLASNQLDRLEERIDDKYIASLIQDECTAYNHARLSSLEKQYILLEKEVDKKATFASILMAGGIVLLLLRERLGI